MCKKNNELKEVNELIKDIKTLDISVRKAENDYYIMSIDGKEKVYINLLTIITILQNIKESETNVNR